MISCGSSVGIHLSKKTCPPSTWPVFISQGAHRDEAARTFQPLTRCELYFTQFKFEQPLLQIQACPGLTMCMTGESALP